MNEIDHRISESTANLSREGRHQMVELPEGFELPGTQVTIRRDGDRLILEPKKAGKRSLKDLFDSWEPLTEEEWPDIDEDDLGPLRDVEL